MKIVEQSSASGKYMGKDIKLTQNQLKDILEKELKTTLLKDVNGWMEYGLAKISLKNITYLGNPHPDFKKRVQFSGKLLLSYNTNNINKHVLGHYLNSMGESVFVYWKLAATKVGKSKSSHVFTDDLSISLTTGKMYSRFDKNGNEITVIPKGQLKSFLDSLNSKLSPNSELDKLREFAKHIFKKNNKWDGKAAISEMKDANYNQWKQTEWPGFYFEFLASKYFENDTTVKTPSGKRFGNFSPDMKIKSFIDLKYHSSTSKDVLGNDKEGVDKLIKKHGKLLYLIASGKPQKDKNLEFVNWFNGIKGKETNPKGRVLKSSVEIEDISVITIDKNSINKTSPFQTGFLNSDGKARKEKIKLKLEEFSKEMFIKEY